MLKLSFLRIISVFLIIVVLCVGLFADELQDAQNNFDNGKYKDALEFCKIAEELNSGDINVIFLLSRIYFKLGNLDKAREYIDKAIQLDKANANYREIRNEMSNFVSKRSEALRFIDGHKFQEAKEILLEMTKENPNYAQGYFLLGKVCAQLSELKNAAKYFQKSIELNPDEPKYQETYDRLFTQMMFEGNNLMKRHNFDGALEKFQQAILLDPESYLAHYFVGLVYYYNKKYSDAIKEFDISIKFNGKYKKAFLTKGKSLMKLNKTDDALASFKKAVFLDDKYYDAWNNIGLLYYKTKQYDEAIPAYLKVTKIKPKSEKALENLGAIYIEKKDYENAIKYLNKSVAVKASNYKCWYRIALAYNKLGKAELAKTAAKNSLKYKPKYAPSLIELGAAERRLGNKQEARNAFKMAANDPRWKKIAEYELSTIK